MIHRTLAAIALAACLAGCTTGHASTARLICQAERSNTVEGVEIIAYPAGQPRHPGIVVACPVVIR